ncbi:hypothetical protein [Sphingopyxis sp. BSNA05]|uniref:hypothetical protein n=1 Tax=Sphingopyxis sp. BSNA05 TaxID=1236614 RepID=UPI001564ACE7|nr:hypothetical protein [Sphingopyxis sp. BSNA05]
MPVDHEPPLTANPLARAVALLAIVSWGLLEIVRSNGIFLRPTWPVLGAGVFIVYDLVLWYALGEWELVSHIQMYILLTLLIIYESRRNDPKSLEPVFWTMMLTLPVWWISTLRGFETFGDHAARTVVRSSEEAMELMQQGVGGYSLIYSSLVLIPILILMTFRWRQFDMSSAPRFLRAFPRAFRLLPPIMLGLIAIVVLRAGFTIAVIVMVATSVVSLMYLRPRPWILLMAPLVALFLVILGQLFLQDIINLLIPMTDGTNFVHKLRDLQLSLDAGGSQGTVADRTERYFRSINSFLENPVFGVLGDRGVGNHSAYLDYFAQRGLFFGMLYIGLLLYLPIRMLRQLPGMLSMTGGVLAVMILFPLLNSVTMAVGVVLFIMFPVACAMTREYVNGHQLRRRAASATRRVSPA